MSDRDDTSSISESECPGSSPNLTILPPHTPLSFTSSVPPPMSPSLPSWDSWSSLSSSSYEEEEEDHHQSTTDSGDLSSVSDTVFSTSDNENDDDDDDEEEELIEAEKRGVDKEESETVSDDIITSCVGALSSTSNDNQTDDTDEEIATQIKSYEFRPIHPSTPTCPVNPAYLPFTYSYSTNASADCFMKPPFTVEEERWIVKTDNHPFKDYVLQCWEDMLQSALQQCAPQQHSSMSRTSSEEELSSIFENDNQQSAIGTSALPTQHATQPTQDFVSPHVADQQDQCVPYYDSEMLWNEFKGECCVQQSMALDHIKMTWTSPEEMQVRNGDKEKCQNDGVCESQTSSYLTWSETVGTCDPHTQHSIWSGGAYSLPGIAGNLPTQPATDPLQHHCYPSQNSLFPVITEPEVALPTMGPDELNNCRGWPHLMSNAVFADSGNMQTAPATEAEITDHASSLSCSVCCLSQHVYSTDH